MKRYLAVLLSVLMLLAAASAMAETAITVSGTGETRVSADTAVISLGIAALSAILGIVLKKKN